MATLPKLRGSTFVTGAGTAKEAVVGSGPQVAAPLERLQATNAKTVADLISLFNRFVDNVQRATLGSRSIPFGSGCTVLLAVNFVAGTTLKVAHRLGTSAISVLQGAGSGGPNPVFVWSADENNVQFTPSMSGTCDVFLLVHA